MQGPSISSLPESIGEWVAAYEKSLEFEFLPPNPYLFSLASAWDRGMSSSQWTQFIKSVFQRHAGISVPPKLLRGNA